MWWILVPVVLVSVGASIDASRNPDSWRDFGLMIQDACRYLWFYPRTVRLWATRLKRAYRHTPRHSLTKQISTVPGYMRAWRLL
jgi:hypothetical protein